MLNSSIIRHGLDQDILIDIIETLPSTNDYLKSHLHEAPKICLAEQQTRGKGRHGRPWHSPFAQNIYFSCAYPFQKNIHELNGLSLVISVIVIKTLETYSLPESLFIKWPNDVMYDGHKLSGNLIEVSASPVGCMTIIGIGINVNMLHDNDQSITQPWTSLKKITGQDINRNSLCTLLINHLLNDLRQFEQHGLLPFINEWNKRDYLMRKKISLTVGNETLEGIAMGINAQGNLILQRENGELQICSTGDTSCIR